MAAPATTPRQTPAGIRLEDGYSTQIAFAVDPNISFWEKDVQPPGLDGGDAISTSTMHNTTWRTFAPRHLITLTEVPLVASYDPAVYDQILAIVNLQGSITVHFPDGSTLDFFGYLRIFEPQSHVEGEPPEANIVIQPTNQDPVNMVEAAPVMTEVVGT